MDIQNMEKNELLNVINTLINVEEAQSSLDDYVDSHSECIGTLRKYLLDGIREFIFKQDSNTGCSKTLKSIESSLKGLCCTFGHLVFPLSGLGQLFYRLLAKVFNSDFLNDININLNVNNFKKSEENIDGSTSQKQEFEMMNSCIFSLCTILKLLASENIYLYNDFINETLKNIHKLNSALEKKKLKNNIQEAFQNYDIYSSFIQKLRSHAGWITLNEAPITVNFLDYNTQLQYLLGNITISILITHDVCFESSIIRDRFISSWTKVLTTSIINSDSNSIRINLLILKNITLDFKIRIKDSNMLHIINNNILEHLYNNEFLEESSKHSLFHYFNAQLLTINLVGEFTLWYLDKLYQMTFVKQKNIFLEKDNIFFISQIEIILNYWLQEFRWFSQNESNEYSMCILYKIFEKIPFCSKQISNIIDRKVYKELFKEDHINLNTEFCLSFVKSKLFILILKFKNNKSLLINMESLPSEIIPNILKTSLYRTHELCFNENSKCNNTTLIIAHIQMILSSYFTLDLLTAKNVSLSLYYTILNSLKLVEFLFDTESKSVFDFGLYLINHLCRTIDTDNNNITRWGFSLCLLLSELSIRILSNFKESLEKLIELLVELIGKNDIFLLLIWNCILNFLLINCMNSHEIEKGLMLQIFSKLKTLEYKNKNLFSILIKLLKPLAIMIMRDLDDTIYESVSEEIRSSMKYLRSGEESCFPFGSSFESISFYHKFAIENKENSNFDKKVNFLSTTTNCYNCEDIIVKIPSKELHACKNCHSILPTSIDIDCSTFIPEVEDYFSTIDILFKFKKKKDSDDSLILFLSDKLIEISKIVPLGNDYGFFDAIGIILSFCSNNPKIKSISLEFMQIGFSKNTRFLKYSHYQLLLMLFSKQFLWHNIVGLNNTNCDHIFTTKIFIPSPITLLNSIEEIIDPKTQIYSNIENSLKLSLIFASKTTCKPQKKQEELDLQLFFGEIYDINNLINYLFKLNVNNTKFYRTFVGYITNLNNNSYNISRSHIQNALEVPTVDFVNIEVEALNRTFTSINFTNYVYNRFFGMVLSTLNKAVREIELNWKKLWSRKNLFEFSKGIIPFKKYSDESLSTFSNNSKIIYKILTVLSMVLMKQNTTISSISISPGTNKSTSVQLVSLIESKNKHPNLMISLIGPSFFYILPNLFYKSLTEYASNFNLNILLYLRKFIPSSLSHEKLVVQIPFFFFSLLDKTSSNYIINDESNDLLLNFKLLKKNFYVNLLQISIMDDLELPKALVNTCLAALFWSATNPTYIIQFSLYYESNFENSKNDCGSRVNFENLSYEIFKDQIFIQQCEWLAIRINILINELNDLDHSSPEFKKQKRDFSEKNNSNVFHNVENYMCNNLMWLLEFYSKSIFIEKVSDTCNNIQDAFFPIYFIVTEPPPSNKASMYWFRVFRSISLLLYFSRKYIKKYATRLLELLIKVTQKSNMHPSCIESWYIYITHLLEEDKVNGNIEQNIFLQLIAPIIDQIYLIIEPYISENSLISNYIENFFEYTVHSTLRMNTDYFVLIPIVPNKLGCSLRKILLKTYYKIKNINISVDSQEKINYEYYKLVFELFEKRVDFSLEFLSPNVPHITYEKLLGSIRDMLILFPIESYWAFYGYGKTNDTILTRIYLIYEKCLKIISNASNESFLHFQKYNLEDSNYMQKQNNPYLISRFNLISIGFKKNMWITDSNSFRKIIYNTEKSITNLKNIIAAIIGSIGSIDQNIYSFLESKNSNVILRAFKEKSESSHIISSINKSIFVKNLDTIAIDLIQNHLITYSHWNIAAYAIQEALKYIGCHDSTECKGNRSNVWEKFQPDIQYLLYPYKSTEYRIIQGTKDHLFQRFRQMNDERTENVYEFYFWCLDKINEEINNLKNSSKKNIPDSIKEINVLLEGCRLVSLGISSVFNCILLVSIECIILFCEYSTIRELKEKLCSLVVSGLECCNFNNKIYTENSTLTNFQKNKISNSSSLMIHQITYESIFIVITHLMELYEYILQSKISKFLPWFNESLLEPFLHELYSNEVNKTDLTATDEKISLIGNDNKTLTPSSVTLSLLAEATKIEDSKFSSNSSENKLESVFTENEIETYIYRESLIVDKKHLIKMNENDILNLNKNQKLTNKTSKFLSTLSNYPIIKIVANLQFITDVPISVLIQAALRCGAYTRAILLFERFLFTKQINMEFSKKKQGKPNKKKSLMKQFGIRINYSGNAIDYFGTNVFDNLRFDPLDPLNFYKTCFKNFLDLPHISQIEKRKIINHILYLPYQCYLGINDTDNLLGIMGIYEQISTISEGTIGKQLLESLLREDYIKAATIYERILYKSSSSETNTLIIKNYLRCLLKAGLPKIVLNTLFNSKNINHVSFASENLINKNIISYKSSLFTGDQKFWFDSIIFSNSFVSEALEACYILGNWEYLDFFLSDLNNTEDDQKFRKTLPNNLYIDLLIPSSSDLIMQKFDIYRGKLLLHLHYINDNKLEQNYEVKNKIHESFISTLERARSLLFTPLSNAWNDSHFRSIPFLEKLHILMDIEFTYSFLMKRIGNEAFSQNQTNFHSSLLLEKPNWFSISELFINRVDNVQMTFETKYSLLSQSKLMLEISGFNLASFSILLVLERTKLAILQSSQSSYVNFLNSFEMIEIGCASNVCSFPYTGNYKTNLLFGLREPNLNNILSLSFYGKDSIPGVIQLNNSITLPYFEVILGKEIDSNDMTWTVIEKELLHQWNRKKNEYLLSLNQNLIISYLFNLFQTNQIATAIYFYDLLNNAPKNILDSFTLSEINLVYLDWAIKSSMVSPEDIINIFQKTIKYRSNCEKTYFQFANYLDNYFHLIISNMDNDSKIPANLNSCISNYHLGSMLQYDEIIFQCINMYLNCLKCGNLFIYPSLSRILFLIFNHSNIILKFSNVFNTSNFEKCGSMNALPESLNKIKTEIFALSPSFWYIVLPQLLSRSQHPGLGSLIIQPLIAKILRYFPHQAAWHFISMLKSNSTERKSTALTILKISKSISCEFKNENLSVREEYEYSCIIDEYIRLFENLTVLAMDTSTGANITISKNQKSVNRSSNNKCLSLRTNFQSLYHSMKIIGKSRRLLIPIERQLSLLHSSIIQNKNILFSNMLLLNKDIDSNKNFFSSYIFLKDHSLHFPSLVTISGMEDNIIILPSKQKPKKIGLIGSDGGVYYYLVKNEKRGDLRKDMRLMELAQLINQRMSIKGKELNLRTFSVIPLSEVAGIIEWVPNVTTIGNIVMNEWKELIGNSNFHRQLLETQDTLRQHSMQPEKLYKLYCEEILPKYPPILHNWFFKQFSTKSSYIWLEAKQKYTKSTAVWSMFGYIVGLGDRHAENILIDTHSGDIIHVDFDCLFGKGFLLEIPEIVPFRLTPNIVIAMGSCGVEGTFTRSCISTMNIFRTPFNKSLIMTFLEAFIHDPLIEWMRPGKTSQITDLGISIDPVSFAAVAKGHSHLKTIHRKLNGMIDCSAQNKKTIIGYLNKSSNSQRRSFNERGLGLSVESQVFELISSAKCKRNLSQMYAGWMPQL